MSADAFDQYLNKLKSTWQENKIQSLQLQRKFLAAVRSRHRTWGKHSEDAEMARFHGETADMLKTILDRYDRVLEKSSQG
jgi:hypothetical protein